MTAGLAARSWNANLDLARVARAHPFVRGIADGTLPRDRFAAYVAQDAYFLGAFGSAYAAAEARAPDPDGAAAFGRLLAGVEAELRLHGSYARRWGIDLAAVRPHTATIAYTSFLGEVVAAGHLGPMCAALTPCMRLYAWLGQQLVQRTVPPDDPYREWIATYASPEFDGLAGELERLLDRYADGGSAVVTAYRRAMELEVGFFDAQLAAAVR